MSLLMKANKSLVHIFRQTFATNSRLISNSSSKSTGLLTVLKDTELELMDRELKDYKNKLSKTIITTEEPMDLTTISGVPEEHIYQRRVRISKPTKNAMQSGSNDTKRWKIEFETRERWENPLMGWTSTADPLSNLNVSFATREDAEDFCAKNGWYYEVYEPQERRNLHKNYSENFSWNKRTRIGSK